MMGTKLTTFPCLIFLFGFLCQPAYGGGFENFLCGRNSSKPFASCHEDCIQNHGRTGGGCGNVESGDFNCYCNKELSQGIFAYSLNCAVRSPNVELVCGFDCLCNHAAVGGVCDFERKACICSGVGLNKENLYCPARTSRQFAELSYTYLGPVVLGKYGMQFITNALNVL